MKIAEHFIGPPATNEADDAGIDIGSKKGVGAGCSKVAYRDIRWDEAEGWSNDGDMIAEGRGDHGRYDVDFCASESVNSGEWSSWRCIMLTKMENSTGQGFDGAKERITRPGKTNHFAFHTVFLFVKHEGGECGSINSLR